MTELRVSDIRNRTDTTDHARVLKAKSLVSYYRGISPTGEIIFQTKSQSIPNLMYEQRIRLLDLSTLRNSNFYYQNSKSLFSDSMSGNVGVYCTDPSFLYWRWQYISYTLSYGWRQASFPSIRNPYLLGGVCKHIYHVLMVLPFNSNRIYSDMKRMGLLDVKETAE